MILFEAVEFAYPNSNFVLKIDQWSIQQGQRLALLGPSGSGKTTLLHLAAGILLPSRGSIITDGVQVESLRETRRAEFRVQNIGLVFQSFELLPHLTALQNILLPFRLSKALRLTQSARDAARDLADSLGISPLLDRFPDQLSQGEQQRLAIGRALITQPRVVLADEPTGNLDPASKRDVVNLLLDQCAKRNATVIMATHDVGLIDAFDDPISMHDLLASEACA